MVAVSEIGRKSDCIDVGGWTLGTGITSAIFHIHSVPAFYFLKITMSKITDFNDFGMLNPEKFDRKILQTFPPYLSHVATLPWKIQKVIFNSFILTYL